MAWYFIALFFSLFTATFLRNSENSPFKHVESFSRKSLSKGHETVESSKP